MYYESFPAKLKQARLNAGLTQRDVQNLLNIKQSTLAGYELGRTQPDIETLSNLIDFYNVKACWILGTKE